MYWATHERMRFNKDETGYPLKNRTLFPLEEPLSRAVVSRLKIV
jgi:hypothetical protein